MVGVFFLQGIKRFTRFPQYVTLPTNKLSAEICALPLVHERLVVGWRIIFIRPKHVANRSYRVPARQRL